MHDDYDDDFDLDDFLHKSKSERKFSYGGIMMTPSELERVMRKEDRERERELEERRHMAICLWPHPLAVRENISAAASQSSGLVGAFGCDSA